MSYFEWIQKIWLHMQSQNLHRYFRFALKILSWEQKNESKVWKIFFRVISDWMKENKNLEKVDQNLNEQEKIRTRVKDYWRIWFKYLKVITLPIFHNKVGKLRLTVQFWDTSDSQKLVQMIMISEAGTSANNPIPGVQYLITYEIMKFEYTIRIRVVKLAKSQKLKAKSHQVWRKNEKVKRLKLQRNILKLRVEVSFFGFQMAFHQFLKNLHQIIWAP